ncbi:MAG: ABC transporter permease [Lysobacterales bacterium 69-70]|nr:FtsX-like permease family protein [Xanthomonadaceae bacterium]ODU33403.1 MAG: ABC transporter permease [Xanthomonadaceae bacterium SCN 69-320]ODV17794.1 MAG: ABC transporter permease [Xanthomonadaceae bacterium SCN 69-25]OJZ00944.1 MAG: ABC transporter permease [Xanthomonadales bacterium 69-70]
MMGLARKTLRYEWRRYLPAALAVAFSALLILVQAALVLGVFAGASVYVTASAGELWIGFPGTQSVDMGRPIPAVAELQARLDPAVVRVEPLYWGEGDWRGTQTRGGVSVYLSGIDPAGAGLAFARVLSPAQRTALQEPGAVIVDAADLDKLGARVGSQAEINGRHVRVVDAVAGLRALGGINVLVSLATARVLDPAGGATPSYLLLKLADPLQAPAVAQRLQPRTANPRYAVWPRDEFATRAVRFWLFDTGAGLAFVFGALLVALVGTVVTSQSLVGAVSGNLREYATLRALGVSQAALRRVVLEQALWVGCGGLLLAAGIGAVLLAIAAAAAVPVAIDVLGAVVVGLLVLLVAIGSGLAAMRSLRQADPIVLLR